MYSYTSGTTYFKCLNKTHDSLEEIKKRRNRKEKLNNAKQMHKISRQLVKTATCNQEQDREVKKFVGKETQ